MKTSPRRSALYMPAANQRALEKASGLPADIVIFDLEDSVAPQNKTEARNNSVAAIENIDYGPREVVLRLNGPETAEWPNDLDAAGRCKPDAVLVPKVNSGSDVVRIVQDLEAHSDLSQTGLWLMIETPKAILNVGTIAAQVSTFPCIQGLVIGTNDLIKDTDIQPSTDRALLLPWLMSVVAAAKAFDLALLDGVYNDFADDDGFVWQASQGRSLGMTGKTLIHPRQIDLCNRAFTPSEEEVLVAKKIIKAFETEELSAKGVISIDGKMFERLHLQMAKRTLERAENVVR